MNIQLALRDYYDEIQKAAEARMSVIALQDIIDTYRQKAGVNNGTEDMQIMRKVSQVL